MSPDKVIPCPTFKCLHKITSLEDDASYKSTLNLNNNLMNALESKLEELKFDITEKIDKEMSNSANARVFISQKYDELCDKIQFLSELDATVTGFRSDVKGIEKQIAELASRVDDIEKKAILKECPSLTSSVFG